MLEPKAVTVVRPLLRGAATLRVAVHNASPAYRRGVELALGDAGFVVEQPENLGSWGRGADPRAVVATCLSVNDLDRLATLHVAKPDLPIVAVPAATSHRTVLPSSVARALARGTVPVGDARIRGDQQAWLRQLAAGATVKQLAAGVGYSERAMHRHLQRLYQQLEAGNRTDALLQAMRLGMIE